jgi:hypothetical protein
MEAVDRKNVLLPVGPTYVILDLALKRLPPGTSDTMSLPLSRVERVDEAVNRWRAKIVSKQRMTLGIVEADLIDEAGDQTRWSHRNVTIDGKSVAAAN